jgi:hypothetical protein
MVPSEAEGSLPTRSELVTACIHRTKWLYPLGSNEQVVNTKSGQKVISGSLHVVADILAAPVVFD